MTTYVVSDAGGWVPLDSSGLPNSGVTAGTYGDNTHVAQVTVNAQGQVTAASNVAVAGGGSAGLVQLFASVLGANAASIDTGVGGIASGHVTLLIYILARTDSANYFDSLKVTVNGDGGAHYDKQLSFAAGSTPQAGESFAATYWDCGGFHGNGGTANYPGQAVMTINGYDKTTFYKLATMQSGRLDTTSGQADIEFDTLGWRSTAAINQLTFAPRDGTNLLAGSSVYIYAPA